jgi:hypothetical protein
LEFCFVLVTSGPTVFSGFSFLTLEGEAAAVVAEASADEIPVPVVDGPPLAVVGTGLLDSGALARPGARGAGCTEEFDAAAVERDGASVGFDVRGFEM